MKKKLFLSLDDAVRVAEIQFDIEPAIAREMFEQKCYISDDQYGIGYQDGLAEAINAIGSLYDKEREA